FLDNGLDPVRVFQFYGGRVGGAVSQPTVLSGEFPGVIGLEKDRAAQPHSRGDERGSDVLRQGIPGRLVRRAFARGGAQRNGGRTCGLEESATSVSLIHGPAFCSI